MKLNKAAKRETPQGQDLCLENIVNNNNDNLVIKACIMETFVDKEGGIEIIDLNEE